MHKYGTIIGGEWQIISRKDKRELKKCFKSRDCGTKGLRVGIESFRRIASKEFYDSIWPRAERYPHFKYMANKLQ